MLNIAYGGAWQGVVQSPAAWVFTSVLVVVVPIVDYLLYFRLKSALELYAWNICAEWSLVAGCVWVIRAKGLRLVDIGERLGSPSRTIMVSGLLLAIVAMLVIAKIRPRNASVEHLSRGVGQARRLLPVNRTERAVWVAVALTAGVCEEFLYRGWLLSLIGTALGSVSGGLVVSSIVFGIAHAYQGRNGVIGASALGIGAVFVLSGTLVLGQILHTVIDLNNGFALGKIVGRLENMADS